eukprot:3356110-Pyramimonas_sp.AAC.1
MQEAFAPPQSRQVKPEAANGQDARPRHCLMSYSPDDQNARSQLHVQAEASKVLSSLDVCEVENSRQCTNSAPVSWARGLLEGAVANK